MSKILTIPEPCSENWSAMTPTQKGAFCKSCQKEVIDFTKTSNVVLSQKLSNGNKLCGRFKSTQLNTPLPSITQSNFQRNAALLGYVSLLTIGTPLAAQEISPNTTHVIQEEIIMGRIIPQAVAADSVTIKGNVMDSEYPLPGAIVAVKGTEFKTQTDFDGNFLIALEKKSSYKETTLVISYIGYQTIEKVVPLQTNFVEITCTELEEDIMGELVIVRRQNIFNRFLNLFRKK
ncbi:carboxypeptidase-like regulatory domain-containing protein [uncultured Allomuricauda sp.]|uniref:carboxypeptidase-like regulatory domain-containing protein n=1 Tax=Flagellimonas sp. W118 TaxID=3410791 RepID=UPI00262E2E6A|nr:carboxypeptidase-like regulatory domain-containing protein [uncultured Allomuricauda sp.]